MLRAPGETALLCEEDRQSLVTLCPRTIFKAQWMGLLRWLLWKEAPHPRCCPGSRLGVDETTCRLHF